MKADPSRQQRLLELQALDTRLDQIAHARAALPVQRELDLAVARRGVHEADLVRARAAVADVQRELAKADADVQQVRDRAARDEARLVSGSSGPKELQALQHELASLARRQAELEDLELEVMERAEGLTAEVQRLEQAAPALLTATTELAAARDAALASLDAEGAGVAASRAELAPQVGDDLLAVYEKRRSASGGVGAAALRQRRCEGCRLELNAVDLARIRSAAPDEVLRCEECGRILVRTDESGV